MIPEDFSRESISQQTGTTRSTRLWTTHSSQLLSPERGNGFVKVFDLKICWWLKSGYVTTWDVCIKACK